MSFKSRDFSRCSVRIKTVLASALRAQRRLALFSAADVWCSNPGFATVGGRRVCPVMAREIAVKREASNVGGTSLLTMRCQRESTWCQFFQKDMPGIQRRGFPGSADNVPIAHDGQPGDKA